MGIILSAKYCLAVFIAGLGLYQLAAIRNDLRGILFFRNKGYTYLFATLALIPSLYYFFTWNYRNVTGVIEGYQQAILFTLSMLFALLFTLCLSSLLNRVQFQVNTHRINGLEVLRTDTYFHAVRRSFKANIDD
jgi:hypothetical protein